MNELPQIFRQSQSKGFNRQGPFFNLRLNQTFYNKTSASTQKGPSKITTRLTVNRYSIDRPARESTKKVGYKTISYDHLNDPEFYGTKGQKDQCESYNVLIQERRKAIEILGLKVASCRGFKQDYQTALKTIQKEHRKGLNAMETAVQHSIGVLRQSLSELRRETNFELRSMKSELKEFNEQLLLFCEEYRRVEEHEGRCIKSLEAPIV